MLIRVKRIVVSVAVALCPALLLQAQNQDTKSDGSALREHYDAALRFQKAGDLVQSSAQYRAFIADALGEMAAGRAHAGEYAAAGSLLDEALALAPGSSALRLEYARTALLAGDFPHAETLARDTLKDASDFQSLAQAHQILGRALLKMNQDQDARKELETAVALDPSFENGYALAVVCLDLDDEKCAVQLFDEMQASFGDTPAIHMDFGRAYGNSDSAPRAVAEFSKAIAESPRLPGAHYALAAALLATGQDEKTMQAAETELKKELAISPRDFLTYAALGKIEAAAHQYPQAEKYLKQATTLNPRNPDAFLYLGQMYFDINRPDEAKDALLQAVQLTTDVTRNRYQIQKAHFLLGRILMQENRQDEAHAEMQIARSLANKTLAKDKSQLAGLLPSLTAADEPQGVPANPAVPTQSIPHDADPGADVGPSVLEKQMSPVIADSYNNLGAITATGNDYVNALKYFKRAAQWNPTLDGLDSNLGHAAFMASSFSEAIAPLSRYLGAHPDDSGIRAALGISQFMTHDYKDCVGTLQPVEAKLSSIRQVQYVYADSLVKTGQISSGVEHLEALEKSQPEVADIHSALGDAYERKGERQKAIGELQTAIRLNANDPETHDNLGKAELQAGDAASAVPELESAVRLQPSNPKFHQDLAGAYKLALRPADAAKELQIYNQLSTSQAQPAQDAPAPAK